MRFFKTLFLCCILSCNAIAWSAEVQNQEQSEPPKKISWLDLRIPDQDYTEQLHEIREKKLNGHKHLGMLTLGLAAASAVTAVIATNKMKDKRAGRRGVADKSDADEFNLHAMTAGLTLASYLTTAYFSLSAPKAESMQDTEALAWHKRFAAIHMPAMIIGPILGLLAINDYKKGKDPSGVSKLHKPVMALGVAALAGAVISIEF